MPFVHVGMEREGELMLQLKSCPKCSGDLAVDRDIYGWFRQCIQCSYIQDISEAAVKQIAARVKNRTKARTTAEVAA